MRGNNMLIFIIGAAVVSAGCAAYRLNMAIRDGDIDYLVQALEDRNPQIRLEAAGALDRMGRGKSAVPAMTQLLSEGRSREIRDDAARVIGKIGPEAKEAVPALIHALKHDEAGVRYSAALAIANIGPEARAAIPALVDALDDPCWFPGWSVQHMDYDGQPDGPPVVSRGGHHVRAIASLALTKITGKDFGQNKHKWNRWWERNKDEYATHQAENGVIQRVSPGGAYLVQVGSFTDFQAAVGLRKKLEKKGYPVSFSKTVVREQTFYRVRVGPYLTKADARGAGQRLAQEERLRVWIVKRQL